MSEGLARIGAKRPAGWPTVKRHPRTMEDAFKGPGYANAIRCVYTSPSRRFWMAFIAFMRL